MKELIIREARQQRSKAKFDAILAACPRVLDEFGYQKTTTTRIALEADVGIGTLYDYFNCKEAVLVACLDHRLEKALAKVEADAADPSLSATESMTRLVASGIDFAEQEKLIIRALVYEIPQQLHQVKLAQSREKTFAIARAFFSCHGESISLKNKQAELIIYSLTNLVLGFQLRIALMENPEKNFSRKEIIDELTGIIANYLFK